MSEGQVPDSYKRSMSRGIGLFFVCQKTHSFSFCSTRKMSFLKRTKRIVLFFRRKRKELKESITHPRPSLKGGMQPLAFPRSLKLAPSHPRSLVATRPQPRGKTPRCFQVLDIPAFAAIKRRPATHSRRNHGEPRRGKGSRAIPRL